MVEKIIINKHQTQQKNYPKINAKIKEYLGSLGSKKKISLNTQQK